MKTISFLLAVFAISIIFVSCNKDELDYADESIIVNSEPSISIYKTKQNYRNFIAVSIDSVDNVVIYPVYDINSLSISIDRNGVVKYKNRWFLKSGYIVEKEISYENVFTNVTFQEQVDYIKSTGNEITGDWYRPRIIDKQPFTEYYWLGGLGHPIKEFTLGQINKMIETGTIETVFTKIK
jgi:hypothetical protein